MSCREPRNQADRFHIIGLFRPLFRNFRNLYLEYEKLRCDHVTTIDLSRTLPREKWLEKCFGSLINNFDFNLMMLRINFMRISRICVTSI